jgi:hypothetical protein
MAGGDSFRPLAKNKGGANYIGLLYHAAVSCITAMPDQITTYNPNMN